MTKLSAAQKQQIRQQWETKTSRELQDEFGCSKSTIRRVMQEGGETSSGINLTVTDESKEEDDNFVYSAVDEERVQDLPLVSSFEGDDGLPTDAAAAAVEQEAFDSLLPPAGATQEDIAKASEGVSKRDARDIDRRRPQFDQVQSTSRPSRYHGRVGNVSPSLRESRPAPDARGGTADADAPAAACCS